LVINARYLLVFPSSAKKSPFNIFLHLKEAVICSSSLSGMPLPKKRESNYSKKLFE
jgi:hypothetical protein